MNTIYKPKGAAAEYGDYAVNIYTGCPHRCYYCFAPGVLHRDREAFHSCVGPRKDIVTELRRKLEREKITGKLVHLCFTCDPYPTGHDTTATREIIKALKEYKWSVGLRHKATGTRLDVHVWAPTNDEATHRLCGVLIGPECDYEWTGTGPVYENNKTVEREAHPAIYKEEKYMKTPVSAIAPGKVISYRGEPCIVLERRQDGTLLLGVEYVEHTFGSSNNFAASSLRQHLNSTFLDCITQNNPDEIIARTVDLTALNGSKEYGTCEAKVAPLTLDELRKYHDIIPKPEVWEWSATPWSTPKVNENDRWVLGLDSSGVLDDNSCSGTYGSRPAFLIPSTLTIEVDGDINKDSNPLAAYSKLELVEELYRREWME